MAGLVIYCGNNRFLCFLFAYCSPLFICFRVRLIIHTTLSISLAYNNAVDLHIQNVLNEDKPLFFILTCSMYRERMMIKKQILGFQRNFVPFKDSCAEISPLFKSYLFAKVMSYKKQYFKVKNHNKRLKNGCIYALSLYKPKPQRKAILIRFYLNLHNFKVETVFQNCIHSYTLEFGFSAWPFIIFFLLSRIPKLGVRSIIA